MPDQRNTEYNSGLGKLSNREVNFMPEKSPETYAMITYAWVMLLASWGGIVNYMGKVRDGRINKYSLTELIGEITSSAFFGLLTFWLCEASHIDPLITAALVGVSGHLGARTMFIIERVLQKRMGISFDDKDTK